MATSLEHHSVEMHSLSRTSSCSAVPLCDPQRHTQSSVLPHMACHLRPQQNMRRSTTHVLPSRSVTTSSWQPAETKPMSAFPSVPSTTIPRSSCSTPHRHLRAPPTTPCRNGSKSHSYSPLCTGSIPLSRHLCELSVGELSIRDNIVEHSQDEDCANPIPELSGAFADSPVLGYTNFSRHHRNVSAPVSHFDYQTRRFNSRAQRPPSHPPPSLGAPFTLSPSVVTASKQLELPQDPSSSPPLTCSKQNFSTRNARPPRPPTVPLSLFPPPSPTNSLEYTTSTTAPSPTGLRRLSLLYPRVSVFEDDDEKLGLLDYLKRPRRRSNAKKQRPATNRGRTLSGASWKRLLCCVIEDD